MKEKSKERHTVRKRGTGKGSCTPGWVIRERSSEVMMAREELWSLQLSKGVSEGWEEGIRMGREREREDVSTVTETILKCVKQ